MRREPFLRAGSPIKHLAAHACPRRSLSKNFPTVERARVQPQFGGEFFLG